MFSRTKIWGLLISSFLIVGLRSHENRKECFDWGILVVELLPVVKIGNRFERDIGNADKSTRMELAGFRCINYFG